MTASRSCSFTFSFCHNILFFVNVCVRMSMASKIYICMLTSDLCLITLLNALLTQTYVYRLSVYKQIHTPLVCMKIVSIVGQHDDGMDE